MNERPSSEWNAAVEAVAAYLDALRVSNRTVRDRVTTNVIEAVAERAKAQDAIALRTLAMQELERLMTNWFASVLNETRPVDDAQLSARGRLALLLADMPGRWQAQYLQPAPWPPEFTRAMRESFLHTRPDDQFGHMQPRPIDLGPIAALTRLRHLPYYGMLLAWLGFAALLVMVFRLTH